MKKFLKKHYLLILITLIGFIIRIAGLTSLPPSLNWDEVSHGFNAYSILKTGKDEWGVWFPAIFPAFGDYKLPVYIYLTVPMVALLGLNAFSVRLISVLAGVSAIPLIYLLANLLLKNLNLPTFFKIKNSKFKISHLAAFTLALFPWHIFISRPALEANLALTFIIAALYFLLKKSFLPASILFALSLHTYNTARIFVPLILIFWFLIYRPKIKIAKTILIPAGLFLISFILVFNQVLTGVGTARYQQISPLSQRQVFIIGQKRSDSDLPGILPRLIYNRPVQVSRQVLLKYFYHFTLSFAYQTNGPQYQFAIPQANMITWPVIITLILGLFYLLRQLQNKNFLFILILFLLSPLPDSLTIDPPHALRSSLMIPFIVILSSIGLLYLTKALKSKTNIIFLFIFALILSSVNYWKIYNQDYKINYSASWQYGYSQTVNYLKSNQDNYSRIIFSKRYAEPHIFYAFYTKLAPQNLWPNGDNIRFTQSNWRWTDKIGKVFFVNDWQIPSNQPVQTLPLESGSKIGTRNSLLVTSPDHLPSNSQILKQINFLDGSPAFIIAKFK